MFDPYQYAHSHGHYVLNEFLNKVYEDSFSGALGCFKTHIAVLSGHITTCSFSRTCEQKRGTYVQHEFSLSSFRDSH